MKTIVVPIDFSSLSLNGLKLAIMVANKYKASICMVHVQTTTKVPQIKEKFEEIVLKFDKRLKYGKLEFVIRKGKIYKEVANQAKYLDAGMIVSSTHGISGFEEFFIGSNAYKIASLAPCPVLTIRRNTCPSKFERIVVPIDTSKTTRQKLNITVEFAKIFKSEVHILAVASDKSKESKATLKSYLIQVEEYMKKNNVPYEIQEELGGNIAANTMTYAKGVNADLIVIMTEQEETFSNVLMGPYAQQMVNHSSVPVLCVHPREGMYRMQGISG